MLKILVNEFIPNFISTQHMHASIIHFKFIITTKELLHFADDLNESANWLKTYIEPWDLVIQNWKKTFPLRKVDNTIHTVEEYMEKWPILKHKDAYMLVCET